MGRYSTIWKEVKTKGFCVIAAPAPLHRRIVKAVITAKYKDVGFRLQAAEAKQFPKLIYIVEQSRIRYFLTMHPVFKELEGIDL